MQSLQNKMPLPLQATATNWRLFMLRKADKAFQPFQQKIFARDNHTCQFCGFQAQEALDIVNVDGNFQNNKMSNLVTACPFCSQCFFLESVDMGEFGGGQLIYCPQMTQAQVNALCHVLFFSIAHASSYATEAKDIYRSLRLCSQQIEKEFGEGFSNPNIFGCLYIESEANKRKDFNQVLLEHVRLLPSLAKFTKQVKQWSLSGLQQMSAC
ncbi:MAG: type IV secretion protein IcmJ [Gammaproteobacteria bacterium RIFCSPHIGHO2_12_FULL_41_15]|nr:MAG: type IV secretion protein IcmJ [Gammaproteobacteria bacterium RIFCSPHIGHO2_12_FULL_41_15]